MAVLSGVYLMQVIELWGHYRYGGVIVVTACGLYALAALAEGIGWWRKPPLPGPKAVSLTMCRV